MGHRPITTGVLILCFGWLVVTAAHGQRARAARISRPSERSASVRIGLTGSRYTRQYDTVTGISTLRAGARAPTSAGIGFPGARGLEQPNFFGAAGRVGRLPPVAVPQAFTVGRIGYQAHRAAPQSMFEATGTVSAAHLAIASRLQASFALSSPLTGPAVPRVALPDRPYFVPESEGTAFHQFFGLKPTKVESVPETLIPPDGWVGLLEQENEEIVRRMESRALEMFKQAMTPDLEDRAELLSKAQGLLKAVRNADPQAYIPSVLLVHAALEKMQLEQALSHLAEAVQRHPSLFVERPDLASYFGDPRLLEAQMRACLRLGDVNPHPSTYTLQAYAAWVLNDRVRLRHAIERMTVISQEVRANEKFTAILYALAAAVK